MNTIEFQKKVVIPWDGSKSYIRAVDEAFRQFGGATRCCFAHVTRPRSTNEFRSSLETLDDPRDNLREIEQQFRKQTGNDARLNDASFTILFGETAREISAFARGIHAVLVIIPVRHKSPIWSLLWGSTAERVVRFSQCPVLVVKSHSTPKKRPFAVAHPLLTRFKKACQLSSSGALADI